MIPVLSRAEMRAFDAHATDVSHVPSLILMENAGRGAADVIEREQLGAAAFGKLVAVVCGTGNNGGDGFVVARHLRVRGAHVEVWLAADPSHFTVECRANHDAFVGIHGSVTQITEETHEAYCVALRAADVIVDAIFGTGLSRPVGPPLASFIDAMNQSDAPKVALDIPSGIDADTGMPLGPYVRAQRTVTFGHLKLGHVSGSMDGPIDVVDIGVPGSTEATVHLVEASDVQSLLSPRAKSTHKYLVGHVALVAGSEGKTGAAQLSALSALRGGAGAATIVTWKDAARAVDRIPEVMTARLEDSAPLGAQLDRFLKNKRAVLVGPGFGLDDRAKAAASHIFANYTGPIVADADALSLFAGDLAAFHPAQGRIVLTPHAGELARLLGTTSENVQRDRFAAVRTAAQRTRAVLVLKGPFSLIASPDGRVVVNPTGNPALATAGSGDVLAGVLTALLCSLPPFEAAWGATYLHGAAGDAWARKHGDRGLLASEIANALPDVTQALLRPARTIR